jgi:hypothetical protein
MPTSPTNYTITSVTYNNVQEDSTVYLTYPTAVLVISPLDGYYLDYTQFSLEYPPIYTTSAVFTQDGVNVILTLTFDTEFVMPNEDVDIPLCINGDGQLLNFRVTGTVVYTALTNAYVDSEINPFDFDTSNNYNEDVIVYNELIVADPGYFFSVPPTLRQVSGNPANFRITHTDYLDVGNNIISREYSINYLTPNYDSLNNIFNLKAIASQIYVPLIDITSYLLSNNSVPLSGGLSALTVYGGAGAYWELTCASPILQTGPRDPITGLIPYGTNVSGTLDNSGVAVVGISVGSSVSDTIYSILLEGDLSVDFAQQNPILIYQFSEVVITYTTSPNTYFINDGNKVNTGYGLTYPAIGQDGFDNDFDWDITPVSNYGMVLIKQPSIGDFNNLSFPSNKGNLVDLYTILATQTSPTTIIINFTGKVEQYGFGSITTTLDLSKSIAYIDTTIPSLVTETTAILGGTIGYSGTSGTFGVRGVCYSTSTEPTIDDTIIVVGSGFGSFTTPVTGLIAETTYYVRAYGYNSLGDLFYGPEKTFLTSNVVILDPFDYIIVTYQYNPDSGQDYDLDTMTTLRYPTSTITGVSMSNTLGFITNTGLVGCGSPFGATIPEGNINNAYLAFGGDDVVQTVAGAFGESVVINFKNA